MLKDRPAKTGALDESFLHNPEVLCRQVGQTR